MRAYDRCGWRTGSADPPPSRSKCQRGPAASACLEHHGDATVLVEGRDKGVGEVVLVVAVIDLLNEPRGGGREGVARRLLAVSSLLGPTPPPFLDLPARRLDPPPILLSKPLVADRV